MLEYCFTGNIVLCYVVIACTSLAFAIGDLVGRFKSGNKIETILWGKPQFFFYVLNVGAGLFTLFASEAMGTTQIFALVSQNLPLAALKAAGLGLATFISIRSTISTLLTSSGQKLEVGPGRIFAALLENIERRIDQNRMVIASQEIKSIAPNISPRAVLNLVLPYCFGQAEKEVENRKVITGELTAIYTSDRNISSQERSALMLSLLHKVFGLSVLESAIPLINETNLSASGTTGNEIGQNSNIGNQPWNKLQSTDEELEKALRKLSH